MPDLIILDANMPNMDGFAAASAIKSLDATKHIPIIFATADGETPKEELAFSCGAVDYVVKPIRPNILLARVNAHLALAKSDLLKKSHREAIHMLAHAGHYNDNDTGNHIWRMAQYSSLIASAIGQEPHQASLLELAAPMHDMGKIGIPHEILKKPGPLTDDEWVIMRAHTTIGHSILSRSKAPVFALAAEIALHHHEKWDGSGYPGKLASEDIPLPSRIVAIADVFDALTMKRPYKEPWPVDKIVQHMSSQAGKHFDPRLLEAFFDHLPHALRIKEKFDSFEAPNGYPLMDAQISESNGLPIERGDGQP